MKSLKKVLTIEKSVQEMLSDLTAHLAKDVSKQKLKGVKTIKPNMVIVQSSNLLNNIWSPEYYIQSSQSEVVQKKLSSVKTATAFVKELEKMVEEKRVKIGSDTTYLNPKTVEVLERYLESV